MVIVEWLGDGTAGIGTERRDEEGERERCGGGGMISRCLGVAGIGIERRDEEGEKERCGGGGMISRCLGKRIGGGGMKGVGGTTKIGGTVGAGGRS